jgi:ubiquinone/menaquinone biosynthesis C-methylase UbiE
MVEMGCGPGDLVTALDPEARRRYVGTDLSLGEVLAAGRHQPARRFLPASAYGLPFPDSAADLVVACEVLEHLDDPAAAVAEAARVARRHVLVSVPWEPVWRLLNLARGSYWSALGSTPGHVQHFSRRAIRRLVGRHLEVVAERRPFPWTVLLARKRDS